MRRVMLGVVAWLSLVLTSPAAADPDPVTPGDNDLLAHVEDRNPGSLLSDDDDHAMPAANGATTPSCLVASVGDPCRAVIVCRPSEASPIGGQWIHIMQNGAAALGWCEPGEGADSSITLGQVNAAFRRVPLPAAQLVVQPPGGKTLVNFDTIFSTDAEPFQRTIRLLGHEVRLRIRASSFSWHFGDGSEPLSTTEPGRRYQRGLPMDSYITHRYENADVTVRPRVDTTYSAEYSVDGQPFQPVIGTVTIEGVPASLRVVEARPVLTGTR